MRFVKYFLLSVLLILIPMAVLAGNLDDPGAPTTAGGGAMNTLEDIYNLINDGTTNAPRTGTFAEPSAGPSSTGHTLTEVYNRAKTSSRPAKTGETTSYGTGSDGNLQKGVTWPNLRFTDHLDGTVTDNLTGLIWLKNANNAGSTKNWADALTYCDELSDSGYSDWRLPNAKELFSLIDLGRYGPPLPSGHPFTGVQLSYYWSSTTYAANTSSAYHVPLSNAYVYPSGKANAYYVWPVRGGQ